MADYYHTSREHVKKLKSMQDNAARRAERRTELAGISAELPLNTLRIDARPAKLFRNTEQHRAVENMEGMLPWNGNHDNMIDRFDGRALLDFYRDPVPSKRQKTADEQMLDELVALESYRDLVKLLQKGLDDAQGIRAALQENIELRAQAKSAAAAAAGVPVSNSRPAPSIPSGTGAYGAVGFAYGTAPGGEDASDSDAYSSDEESEEEEERPHLDDEEVDNLAANMGIEGYSSMLRRVERQEAEFAAGNVKRAKRMFSRKKAAQRAKRMAGQGLEAFPRANNAPASMTALAAATRDRVDRSRELDRERRRSPSYDRHYSRSRSRSRSPGRRREGRPVAQFITSFSDSKPRKSSRSREEGQWPVESSAPQSRSDSFLDALPSRMDPSVDGGPVALPAAAAVMHGKRSMDYDYRRGRDADAKGSNSSRQRDREPAKDKTASALKTSAVKESPMERLKRLRAAQLNKTFQKDVLSNAQKKANEERDRNARLQIERNAYENRRSPSPPPRYERQGSPENRYSVSPGRRY